MRGFEAKIARSEEHIPALQVAVRQHMKTQFHGLVTEVDLETYADPPTFPEDIWEVPGRIATIFGDIVHNLRCVLDYLAWDLVEANNGVPTRHTLFPILLNRPSKRLQIDGDVSSAALAEIESLQPYHAGHPSRAARTMLGMLRELSNVDKHRYLPLSSSLVLAGSAIGSWQRYKGSVTWVIGNYLDDGARLVPEVTDPNVKVEGQLLIQVAIPPSRPIGSDPPAFPKGYEPLITTVRALHAEVSRIGVLLASYL